MPKHTAELLGEPVEVKWIHAIDECGDHPGQTLLTRRPEVIRDWARVRHATPATGVGKFDVRDEGTALRFEFPGMGRFDPLPWESWFREFEQYRLVFVYEHDGASGEHSHRYRLMTPEKLAAVGVQTPAEP